MTLQEVCYHLAVWRVNPRELIHRSTYADQPERYGDQKHRLHEVVLFFTRLGLRPITMTCLSVAYRNTDYSPVGFGYFTCALKNKNEVLKIYEFSVRCSHAEQQALIASLQKRLELANHYLGEHLASTAVDIEPHPLSGQPAVVLRQKYIAGKPLRKRPYVRQLSAKQKQSLHQLLLAAKKLYDETSYLLDVNGHNLVVQEERVIVVDTILMGEIDAKMRPITLRILEKELALISSKQ